MTVRFGRFSDFSRLHPQIQRRFGFSSADGVASIGTGVMDEIGPVRSVLRRRDRVQVPMLFSGTPGHILPLRQEQRD